MTPNENQVVVASNMTQWSWEYDTVSTTIDLLVDTCNGNLQLAVQKTRIKTGLGAGTYPDKPEIHEVGTLAKPKLAVIRGIMARLNNRGSRADTPFSKNWYAFRGSCTLKTALEYARRHVKIVSEKHKKLSTFIK